MSNLRKNASISCEAQLSLRGEVTLVVTGFDLLGSFVTQRREAYSYEEMSLLPGTWEFFLEEEKFDFSSTLVKVGRTEFLDAVLYAREGCC